MNLVVDTNIVFSALVNTNSLIADIIFNHRNLRFYSVNFLKEEIYLHKNKLLKFSKMSENELDEAIEMIFNKINFINENLIPVEIYLEAENLISKIDIKDTPFVALTIGMKSTLWTGDKKLYNGLLNNGFSNVILTPDLIKITY